MNKRALIYGIIYSALVIAIKLYVLLAGYSLTKFGYYYSSITCVFLILPFYALLIKQVRDKDNDGVIGGREAVRLALTLFAISAVIISLYNYLEFENYGKEMDIEYYNRKQFLDFLKKKSKIKEENFGKIIAQKIKN